MKNKPLMDRLAVTREMQPFVDLYIEWAKEHLERVYGTEMTLVSPSGYAGQMDCLATIKGKVCALDFKTQRYKKGKPSYWDSWPMQLAAYKEAIPSAHPGGPVLQSFTERYSTDENPWTDSKSKSAIRIVSVTINSLEPSPVTHKMWTVEESRVALSTFKSALKIWQNQHKYKPAM